MHEITVCNGGEDLCNVDGGHSDYLTSKDII